MTADNRPAFRGTVRGETDRRLPTFPVSTGRLLLPGRFVLTPSEVPAGAIMAIVGGPYLIWLVRQRGVTS